MTDCPICTAMRQGYASYEAQMDCGHCPACCGCRAALIERLKREWVAASVAEMKRREME